MDLNDERPTLILGGTKGLGREIAIRALAHHERVIVVGRTADAAANDRALNGATFVAADITTVEGRECVINSIWPCREWYDRPRRVIVATGAYHRSPLRGTSAIDAERVVQGQWLGPMLLLSQVHAEMLEKLEGKDTRLVPYDVIVIGSVLAHAPGKQHAVLAGAMAAKVQSMRVFSQELTKDIPGSGMLIVNPWGIKTGFFEGYGVKTDSFMDPAWVAKFIDDELQVLPRDESGKGAWPVEITLDRAKDGSTEILRGPQVPKMK